jgi:hypothetical protein
MTPPYVRYIIGAFTRMADNESSLNRSNNVSLFNELTPALSDVSIIVLRSCNYFSNRRTQFNMINVTNTHLE